MEWVIDPHRFLRLQFGCTVCRKPTSRRRTFARHVSDRRPILCAGCGGTCAPIATTRATRVLIQLLEHRDAIPGVSSPPEKKTHGHHGTGGDTRYQGGIHRNRSDSAKPKVAQVAERASSERLLAGAGAARPPVSRPSP